MGKHKHTPSGKKLSVQEKDDLRSRLPRLIEEAGSNKEAAKPALRACLALRAPIPAELLDPENIAAAFTVREIATSLNRLSKSEVYLDISSALTAIGKAVDKEAERPQKLRILHGIARTITSKLLKLSGRGVKNKKSAKGGRPRGLAHVRYTAATVSSATDLALWSLRIVRERQTKSRGDIYPLALRWTQTVELLWRNAPSTVALVAVVNFLRSLRTVLPPIVYTKLEAEQGVVNFIRDTSSALHKEAASALLDGRLNELETLFSLSRAIDDKRALLLSELKDVCQSRAADVPPESVEWVARHVEAASPRAKAPTPADESQSVSLDYVAVCLLSAWDAAPESAQSARAFENIRRMARELFKLDLVGTKGEIIAYDERQHDLKSELATPPARVELVRPAVRWSDGVRTRILVRAVVREAQT